MFEVEIFIETTEKSPRITDRHYGYVIAYNGKTLHTADGFGQEEKTTIYRIALTAYIKALSRITKPCDITLWTDCNYLIRQFDNLTRWKESGWKNSKGQELKNKDLWQRLDELCEIHEIDFVFSKSHEYSLWLQQEIERRNV